MSAGGGAVSVVVLAAVSASVRVEDEWHWLGQCYFIDVLRWQAGVCSYETGMKPVITLTWCNPTDMVHPHPPAGTSLSSRRKPTSAMLARLMLLLVLCCGQVFDLGKVDPKTSVSCQVV
jgi:hypothetical protein